jgi:hypothetical protein
MPEVTGFYYLLTLADAEDKFQEQNEQNNLFYTTIDPIYFEDGISMFKGSEQVYSFKNELKPSKSNLTKNPFSSAVTQDFSNAYTPEEIMAFFKKEKENGRLDQKVDEYLQQHAGYVNQNK